MGRFVLGFRKGCFDEFKLNFTDSQLGRIEMMWRIGEYARQGYVITVRYVDD